MSPYIRLSDLAGLGQNTPDQLDQAATALEANARQFRSIAAAMATAQPQVAAQHRSQAEGFERQAAQFRERAANERRAAAEAAATRAAVFDITNSLVKAGGEVGVSYLKAEEARKAAAEERKRAQAAAGSGGLQLPMLLPQAPASGGVSTGAMVIGGVVAVSVLGLIGFMVANRK